MTTTELDETQTALVVKALWGAVTALEGQAYHHGRQSSPHYQSDARRCHAEAQEYRALLQHIHKNKEGLAT